MKRTGIYIIKSKIKPERVYVGSAVNIAQRWSDHLSRIKVNQHRSPMLQNHFNKYGIEDLEFSILEECIIDILLEREQYYIDTLKPFFNTLKIAGSPIGHKHSKYTKSIMNKSKIGTHHSEETKRKISKSHKGKKASEESKRKMSVSKIGKKYSLGFKASPETKAKLSLMRMGNTNGRFLKGIKRSDETKKKMSESAKKRKRMPYKWHINNKLKKVA